jgi:hypothetical protein
MEPPTKIPLLEGEDKSVKMDIEMTEVQGNYPIENLQENSIMDGIDQGNPENLTDKQELSNDENAPKEQRTRKQRGPKNDLVISSNFALNRNIQTTKEGQQKGEEKEKEEDSPSKMSLHQKKEAELMELLSSIIMDYEITTEQAQGEKIQRFFSGLYKDIKPEKKIFYPRKNTFLQDCLSSSTTNQVYSTNTFRPSMSRVRQHCSRSREV